MRQPKSKTRSNKFFSAGICETDSIKSKTKSSKKFFRLHSYNESNKVKKLAEQFFSGICKINQPNQNLVSFFAELIQMCQPKSKNKVQQKNFFCYFFVLDS